MEITRSSGQVPTLVVEEGALGFAAIAVHFRNSILKSMEMTSSTISI